VAVVTVPRPPKFYCTICWCDDNHHSRTRPMTTTTRIEDNVEIVTSYTLEFVRRTDRHSGYSIPCDANGVVDADLEPSAMTNYQRCIDGTYDVIAKGVQSYENRTRLCSCGSGEYPDRKYDARGIYLCSCCPKCIKEKLRGFRQDVLDDPNYECDEQIDEDY